MPVECTLVDGKGVGDVGSAVLRERRILGDEGMVIVVLVLDAETGSVLHGPEMFSKGFVFEQHYSHVLEDAKCLVLDEIESVRPGQLTRLQEGIRASLRRFPPGPGTGPGGGAHRQRGVTLLYRYRNGQGSGAAAALFRVFIREAMHQAH